MECIYIYVNDDQILSLRSLESPSLNNDQARNLRESIPISNTNITSIHLSVFDIIA
jgi:hypothetical protein